MKKNWTAPELVSLGITETAGGKNLSSYIDAEVYNAEISKWERALGENNGFDCDESLS